MKSIRLGIIGCGGFVRYHCRSIRDHVKQMKIVGLCDTARDHAERLAAEFCEGKAVPIYADYQALLKEVKPDAVIVSTPHTLHFRHCYDALGASAHVLVEKPMVTNAADARKLVRRAKAKNKCLQIAIQGTHTDTFAYARKLITDGTMGALQLVTGTLAQDWLKLTRGEWRQEPRLAGGGQLYDSMAHVFSAMMFLVNSPVKEVFCWIDYQGAKVDINSVGTIRFANGCLGAITCGGNCPTFQSMLYLQGEGAYMQISPHGGNFLVTAGKLKKALTAVPRGWKIPTVSPARNFADCILGKAAPRCSGRLGILLADLMDALYESADTGRPAKVTRRPPKE